MKFSKLFPNTHQRTSLFLKVIACLSFALICLQQSHSLECYDCLYLAEQPNLAEDGYRPFCLNVSPADPNETYACPASAIYCEKRYMKVTYADGDVTQYLIRECSDVIRQFSYSPPVCFDLPPTESWNPSSTARTLSEEKILKKMRRKGKSGGTSDCPPAPADCNYTTTSRTCVCTGEMCNSGPGYEITANDGTVITLATKPTVAPGDPREGGNPGEETRTVAEAPSIVPPPFRFYQIFACAAISLASHLTTATAAATTGPAALAK